MPDADFFAWLRQAPEFLARAVGREPGNVRVLVAFAKSGRGMEWTLPIDPETGRPLATPQIPITGALPMVTDLQDLVTLRDVDEVDLSILRACALPARAKEIAKKCRLKANAELRRRLSRLRARLGLLDHEKAGYVTSERGRRILTLS